MSPSCCAVQRAATPRFEALLRAPLRREKEKGSRAHTVRPLRVNSVVSEGCMESTMTKTTHPSVFGGR